MGFDYEPIYSYIWKQNPDIGDYTWILFSHLHNILDTAIFYAENSDLDLKSNDEFQQIKEIAKTYGICIKLSYHVYDFRDIDVEYENIDIEEPTPLNYINIGKFIASVSTFDFIF